MTQRNTRRGFTFIELLVVVLIIGILAAVALPQYNKAVMKSRFAEALTNIHTLQQSAQAYLLEHGMIGDIDDWTQKLDIEISSANFTYEVAEDGVCNNSSNPGGIGIWAYSSTGDYIIESDYCDNTWTTYCTQTPNGGEVECALFNQLYQQH